MAATLDLEQLAAASDLPKERLVDYVAAGLLQRATNGRFNTDSLARLRLIRFARDRGIDEEQLSARLRDDGDVLGIFENLGSPTVTSYTVSEAAEVAGLADTLLVDVLNTLGWTDLSTTTDDDVAALRMCARATEVGLPEPALLELLRVYSDTFDRLADAEQRVFHAFVHQQFRSQGLAGRQLLAATTKVEQPLREMVESALLYFHRRAWQRANQEGLLRHLSADRIPPAETPGEEVSTIVFVDLAGFTPLTLTIGDIGAAEVLHRFAALVRPACAAHHGQIVKQIGDAFMLIFTEPSDAVRFGLDLQAAANRAERLPALHVGAHHGSVLYRDADFVGGTVNLAARVTAAGAPGQFLVTDAVSDAVSSSVSAEFVRLPPRELKGFCEPISLVAVRRTTAMDDRHPTRPGGDDFSRKYQPGGSKRADRLCGPRGTTWDSYRPEHCSRAV